MLPVALHRRKEEQEEVEKEMEACSLPETSTDDFRHRRVLCSTVRRRRTEGGSAPLPSYAAAAAPHHRAWEEEGSRCFVTEREVATATIARRGDRRS
nr:hypothetical protein Itr_chr09CG16290 [Ipomoea trifida]